MPDPTYSEALQEALASAPADLSIISTLSIYYPGLVDEGGADADLFVYLGWEGDREVDGIPYKDFKLEEGATRRGGETVEFVAVPFNIILPDMTTNAMVKGKLVLDGVGQEVSTALLRAIELGASVEVTYREYLETLEMDGPQNDPPIVFNLQNVVVDNVQVTGDIGFGNLGNKKFPYVLYTSEAFPALTS
jgi:hypothetical protein